MTGNVDRETKNAWSSDNRGEVQSPRTMRAAKSAPILPVTGDRPEKRNIVKGPGAGSTHPCPPFRCFPCFGCEPTFMPVSPEQVFPVFPKEILSFGEIFFQHRGTENCVLHLIPAG